MYGTHKVSPARQSRLTEHIVPLVQGLELQGLVAAATSITDTPLYSSVMPKSTGNCMIHGCGLMPCVGVVLWSYAMCGCGHTCEGGKGYAVFLQIKRRQLVADISGRVVGIVATVLHQLHTVLPECK